MADDIDHQETWSVGAISGDLSDEILQTAIFSSSTFQFLSDRSFREPFDKFHLERFALESHNVIKKWPKKDLIFFQSIALFSGGTMTPKEHLLSLAFCYRHALFDK